MITATILDSCLKKYKVDILDSEIIESKHYDFYKKYKVQSKINKLYFDIDLFINFEISGIDTQYEITKIYNDFGLLDNTLYYLPKSGFLTDDKDLKRFFHEPIFLYTPENILNIFEDIQKDLVDYKTSIKIDVESSKLFINYFENKSLELEVIYNSNTIFFSINSDKFAVKNKKHYTNIINLKLDLDKLLRILINVENEVDINLKIISSSFSEILNEFEKISDNFRLILDDFYEESQHLDIISDIFLTRFGVVQLSVTIDKPYRISNYVDYIVKLTTIDNQDSHIFYNLSDCFEYIKEYKKQNKF